VGELGFAPALDLCGACHRDLDAQETVVFSHPAGGALCARCAPGRGTGRPLPAPARAALRAWMAGERATLAGDADARAHQRLLREFLREHLADERALRAFDVWERARWG
jgi:DNA repair protein RecO (recombination protein O)